MVVDEKLESLRQATPDDIGGVLQLIEPFRARRHAGQAQPHGNRARYRRLHRHRARRRDIRLRRAVSLSGGEETAEMAALTVSPQVQGQGDGERDIENGSNNAPAGMGLESIFVLTTRTMHWFVKRGFVQAEPDWLPDARKRKYNWDRRSQVFVKKLG